MGEDMAVMIVMPVFFGFIYLVVKLLSDNRIRHKLIDKDMVGENIKHLYMRPEDYGVPSALKWGMVLIAVGLAFLVGQLVPYSMKGEMTVAGVFFFAGLGLVFYYFIARKIGKRSE